jgi:hypothetical protein
MKKPIVLACILCIGTALLFGFDVSVPNEVPGYQDLRIVLTPDAAEGAVDQARFYVLQSDSEEPLYAEFTETDGVWSTVVPFDYLGGEELSYYTQIQTTNGRFYRKPISGYSKARLIQDVTPPALKLLSPETPALIRGIEQLVVFEIIDESGIEDFQVLYNGEALVRAGVFENYLSFIVTPTDGKETKASVEVSLVDYFDNSSKEEFTFTIKKEKLPFFEADADYSIGLNADYTLAMGETTNSTDIGTVFSDMDHAVNLDYELSGTTSLKAGPIVLDLYAKLGDTISVFDILEAYPNTLIADYQNIMNLWHPWNFANEFNYAGEEPRKFYNSNQFLVKLSFFDPIFSYAFGDQKISFQDQTVKDFGFRGSALSIDIPFFSLSLGKGLADLGLYQTAWPKNFFGLKIGIDVFDYWWLQTNISLISSLQGPYETLVTAGTSAIGTLYDLGSIKPEENFVLGLSTGLENNAFKLSANFGLTLYVDDASQIIDKDQLASDINDGFGIDIAPYLGYLDTVSGIFPVLDYFPLSLGLAVKAINQELWGITFGVDLEIPKLNIEAWFNKTDRAYKSLGAAVASDTMSWGAFWEGALGDFDLSVGYDGMQDTIPDILFNDIIPLVKPDLAPTGNPTEDDISNIKHIASIGLGTPSFGILGNFSLDYAFEWATTNAAALAASITDDDAAKSAIEDSTKNDTTLSHTADLRWKSGRIKFGNFSASLGAKTKDSYITRLLVDGSADGTSYWELSYGVSTGLQYARFRLDVSFDNAWSTLAATDLTYAYAGKFTISDIFFDKIALSGGYNQTFNSSNLQVYKITGGIALDKRFGPLTTSTSLAVEYLDSLVDNTDDALTAALVIKGGITF